MIKKVFTRINRIIHMKNRYFAKSRDEIAGKNLLMVKHSSIIAIVILLVLLVIVHLVFPLWHTTIHYILFLPVLLLFFAGASYHAAKEDISYFMAQRMSVLYCVALMSFAITIDVFPYPHSPSSFTPLIFIILPVLVILPFSVIITMDIVFETVYVILETTFKSPNVIGDDIFNSIAGVLFSLAVVWIIMKLRAEDAFSKERYIRLSTTDLLTGLLNKMHCEQTIMNYLRTCEKFEYCGLMIMDVDDFKQVNDTYGHLVGDKVLEMVGNMLSRMFTEQHVVGRIGGDEFMIFIRDVSDFEQFEAKCEAIVKEMELTQQFEFKITCSIGLAVIQNETIAFEELFQTADKALYQAKSQGKNQHVICKYQRADALI